MFATFLAVVAFLALVVAVMVGAYAEGLEGRIASLERRYEYLDRTVGDLAGDGLDHRKRIEAVEGKAAVADPPESLPFIRPNDYLWL